jgi:hypothetical protein
MTNEKGSGTREADAGIQAISMQDGVVQHVCRQYDTTELMNTYLC